MLSRCLNPPFAPTLSPSRQADGGEALKSFGPSKRQSLSRQRATSQTEVLAATLETEQAEAPSVPQTSFSDVRDVTRGQASSRMRLPLEPEGEEEATTVQVV